MIYICHIYHVSYHISIYISMYICISTSVSLYLSIYLFIYMYIYIYISPQWLCGNSCTWAHDVRFSCAQVHELPQSHCGDNRESTLFS